MKATAGVSRYAASGPCSTSGSSSGAKAAHGRPSGLALVGGPWSAELDGPGDPEADGLALLSRSANRIMREQLGVDLSGACEPSGKPPLHWAKQVGAERGVEALRALGVQ